MMAITVHQKRIKDIMLQAVGRLTKDRFARWKHFANLSRKVGAATVPFAQAVTL